MFWALRQIVTNWRVLRCGQAPNCSKQPKLLVKKCIFSHFRQIHNLIIAKISQNSPFPVLKVLTDAKHKNGRILAFFVKFLTIFEVFYQKQEVDIVSVLEVLPDMDLTKSQKCAFLLLILALFSNLQLIKSNNPPIRHNLADQAAHVWARLSPNQRILQFCF